MNKCMFSSATDDWEAPQGFFDEQNKEFGFQVDVHMTEYTYKGYTIRQAAHPTPINPNRIAWDIYDGYKLRKQNISTLDVAKHIVDTMIKYGYWLGKVG